MGKKRGVHIVKVEAEPEWSTYYIVEYKRSKCRYAQTHLAYVRARDELEAYIKVAIDKEGANT